LSRQADILRPVISITATPPSPHRFLRCLLQLLTGVTATLWFSFAAIAAETLVSSTRVWPAPDYTRVTIESQQPIRHKLFNLDHPDRLVLDLEDVALSATLTEIASKISADDPYIKGVRAGRFKPGTVRLVFDLKAKVKPEAFALAPIAGYGHRLVLDIYPLTPPDPLLAFLKRRESGQPDAPAAAAPAPVPAPAPGPVLTPTPDIAAPEPAPPQVAAKADGPPAAKPAPSCRRIVTDANVSAKFRIAQSSCAT